MYRTTEEQQIVKKKASRQETKEEKKTLHLNQGMRQGVIHLLLNEIFNRTPTTGNIHYD